MAEEITNVNSTDTNPSDSKAADNTQNQTHTDNDSNDKLDKLIQSRVDRLMADERKKTADLQKKLDRLSREKLSDEEIKKAEIEDREKAIAQKERELNDRENRLYAIKKIKEIGLDDGSDKSLELVNFVLDKDEEAIETKVKAFNDLVKRFVSAEVDKTFKLNGRTPDGTARDNNARSETKAEALAKNIGKQAAETNKQTASVLNHYLGGRRQ